MVCRNLWQIGNLGGMGTDQLIELKRLKMGNERLRKAVSDLTLDNLIPKEAALGNFWT